MQKPPFIEDYLNEVHDMDAVKGLIELNQEYHQRHQSINRQEGNYKPGPVLVMGHFTNTGKDFDFSALRRDLDNEMKLRVAQFVSPYVEDKEKLAELQQKHAPDQEYLDRTDKNDKYLTEKQKDFLDLIENERKNQQLPDQNYSNSKEEHSQDLTAKQEDFEALRKAGKEWHAQRQQKQEADKAVEERTFFSMSARFNMTLNYSEITEKAETILNKEDMPGKTDTQPIVSMSQRFNQTLGYSGLNTPSEPGASKETKEIDPGKDDPNDPDKDE